MITRKEAFKLGFVTKLATAGVKPSEVIQHALDKKAAASAMLALPAGLAAGGALAAKSLTSGATSIGEGLGDAGAVMVDDDAESVSNLRKEYLIKRYQDLINRRKAEIDSKLISEAKRSA